MDNQPGIVTLPNGKTMTQEQFKAQQPAPVTTPATPTTPVAPITPTVPTAPVAPTAPTSPVVPVAPATPTSSQTYIVQPGDTLSAIASKLGVKPTDLSGYRSGNPNLIFPKEVLQVGQSAPTAPVVPPPVKPDATGGTGQPQDQQQKAPEQVSAEQQALDYLKTQYGFDGSGLATQPQKSIQDLITEVMTSTGLPDTKSQITDITSQIEALNNERDAKIAEVNDNPWLSESMRASKISKLTTEYENKTANKVSTLTLLQNTYDSARQQAQWAVNTAVSMFNQQQNFDQNKLEFMINQTEKTLEAQQKLGQDKVSQDQNMVDKGYQYVKTPAERDRLKNEGYQIVELGGRTYAKPQKLTKVTYHGVTTWYNEQGERVNPSSSQIASQGGGSTTPKSTTPKFVEKTSVSKVKQYFYDKTGSDKKVSPQDYNAAKNAWVSDGGTAESFDANFYTFKNPTNPNY